MERWVAKVISIVVALFLPLICMLIPYPMAGYIERKGKLGEIVICRMMCFGGGIFFGTFLLHIGPEARAQMDEYVLIPNGITYPLTDLIIGCGFFCVLLLEKTVMKINKRRNQAHQRRLERNCEKFRQMSQSCQDEGHVCSSCASGKPCEELEGISTDFNTEVTNVSSRISMQVADIEDIAMKSSNIGGDCSLTGSGNCCHDSSSLSTCDEIIVDTKSPIDDPPSSTLPSSTSTDDRHDHDVHGHHNMRSLILIMALSLHHLFEGLSLGLQNTVGGVFTMLIALMCHETVISFSLGLEFVKSRYSLRRFVITAVAVSTIMPLGIAIGTVMTEVGAESNALEIADGVMQAYACGSFIFITFFEILNEEIDPHDTSIGKVACVALGFFIMALLQLIPDEPSGDEEMATTTTSSGLFWNLTTLAMTTANGVTTA